MSITKGTFKDGHTGWRVIDFHPKYNSIVGYEVIYSDDGECVAEFVANEDDAKLIAAAPAMVDILRKIMNIENAAFGLNSFSPEKLKSQIEEVLKTIN